MRQSPITFEPDLTLLYAGAGLILALRQKAAHPDRNYDFEIGTAICSLFIGIIGGDLKRRYRDPRYVRVF